MGASVAYFKASSYSPVISLEERRKFRKIPSQEYSSSFLELKSALESINKISFNPFQDWFYLKKHYYISIVIANYIVEKPHIVSSER
jgi:hypothetical protein